MLKEVEDAKREGRKLQTLDEFLEELQEENQVWRWPYFTIYDKNEINNVSDEYIKWLVAEAGK